ncbi:MAG: glutamate ligase domain-containing protein, partial [Abiotrophia defectiva]
DWIIFTADNPRHEPVAKICAELIGNHDEVPYEVIEDRKAAIDYVISQAQAGDLLVFAGKGSEPYQIIGDDKLPYDEVTEIEAAVTRHFG